MGGLQSQRRTVVRKRLLEGNYDFVIIHYTAFSECLLLHVWIFMRVLAGTEVSTFFYFSFHYHREIVLKGASFAVN